MSTEDVQPPSGEFLDYFDLIVKPEVRDLIVAELAAAQGPDRQKRIDELTATLAAGVREGLGKDEAQALTFAQGLVGVALRRLTRN